MPIGTQFVLNAIETKKTEGKMKIFRSEEFVVGGENYECDLNFIYLRVEYAVRIERFSESG